MLSRLYIQNYALIERLEISLQPSFVIITGETGAGKSILLGALNLILGNRADSQMLFDKEKKCFVEAVFDLSGYPIQNFFEEQGLDFESQTIIRREINKEGKSRAFINDTPVTANILRLVTSQLIDIHSQRDSVNLLNPAYQMQVIDAFASTSELLKIFRTKWSNYKATLSTLEDMIRKESIAKANLDFLQFQWNELDSAALKSGEQELLEQELETLNHAGDIGLALERALALLSSESAAISQMSESSNIIKQISRYGTSFSNLYERINSVLIEVKDIVFEIESSADKIQLNPARVEVLNERIDLINKLQHKHHVSTVEELIQVYLKTAKEIESISSMEEGILLMQKEKDLQNQELVKIAKKLSEKRHAVVSFVEQKLQKMLQSLSMPDARLKVSFTKTNDNDFNTNGVDVIEWLFSANKGHDFKTINKVASGGELSRVMLCIKAMMAEVLQLPTMIFDEIDSGVSGNVAIEVGKMMNQIARKHQVIAITHLPQIAGKGNQHFLVYKELVNQKTNTAIKELNEENRITEIAKMIGGAKPSASAFENAKELMQNY